MTTRILRKMEEENKKEKEGASFSMQVKEELSYVEEHHATVSWQS